MSAPLTVGLLDAVIADLIGMARDTFQRPGCFASPGAPLQRK
jgi:hypothetical protein